MGGQRHCSDLCVRSSAAERRSRSGRASLRRCELIAPNGVVRCPRSGWGCVAAPWLLPDVLLSLLVFNASLWGYFPFHSQRCISAVCSLGAEPRRLLGGRRGERTLLLELLAGGISAPLLTHTLPPHSHKEKNSPPRTVLVVFFFF